MNRTKIFLVVISVLGGGSIHIGHARADAEVDQFLRKFDGEPTVRDVQVAAMKYYKVNPERISSLRTRTRTKALVPGITIGIVNTLSGYHLDIDDIVFRNSGIAIIQDESADFLGLTASLSWSLDRLVFNAEELDVMSLIGIQDGIQREVTALYYVRRRLQIQLMLKPPDDLQAKLSAQLRFEELTGLLDAYTGGYFSKNIRPRSAAVSKPLSLPTATVSTKARPTNSATEPAHPTKPASTAGLAGLFSKSLNTLKMRLNF